MNNVPHYNAFISYRHHPQDIAVAEAIHKGLERFKVPSSLKKQGKKIDRIFRDKEELPITSSLTDTITTALANSDYLIVICSTHLQESYWVLREIENFLQTHTKDQILTVIVDGEPQDVIPEILTYREVTDPVTGETIREPLEPLSCDWRLPKRKAIKTELPRLAAVLLGCTYNDLIQRQKQYRMRRLAISAGVGMAASLALAGYFLYTSIQIQENLNRSLRNQSQFLASTASTLFGEGDRLTAITLALEALPSEENPRPYVVAAEEALSEALMLYTPEKDIIAVGAYTADALVRYFTLTDDGTTLYILDQRNGVTVWDTETFEKTAAFQLTSGLERLYTDARGNLLTRDGADGNLLVRYSPKGELLWSLQNIDSFALTKDKSLLLATTETASHHQLLTLDPATGKSLREPVNICPKDSASSAKLDSRSYYNNHPYLVTLYDNEETIGLLYPDTGEFQTLAVAEHLIYHQDMTADGRALLNLSDGSGDWNGDYGTFTTVGASNGDIYCFDRSGKQLWCTRLTNYMYSDWYTLEAIPDSDNIFAQSGNNLSVLDGKTGKVLSHCLSTSYPLTMIVYSDRAWAAYADGTMGDFYFDKQEITTIQYMESGLVETIVHNGGYSSKELSRAITKYMTTADESYLVLSENYGGYISDSFIAGDHIMISDYRSLTLFDLNRSTAVWTDEEWEGHRSLLGFNADHSRFYAGYNYNGVLEYDTATGTKTLLPFPTYDKYPYEHIGENMVYHNNHIYYSLYVRGETLLHLVDWNLADNSYLFHDIPIAEDYLAGWNIFSDHLSVLYADDNRLLARSPDAALYELLLTDGTCRVIMENAPESPVFLMEDDRIILGADREIRILDQQRSLIHTIPLTEAKAVSLHCRDGILYVLCDDGYLYRMDETLTPMEPIPLSLYSNFYHDVQNPDSMGVPIRWDFTPDGELVLNADTMGNIIPAGQSGRRAEVPHLLCYHAPTDRFIATHNSALLAYDRLTTQEVMERGRSVLGSFTLTDDQKTYYGLQ